MPASPCLLLLARIIFLFGAYLDQIRALMGQDRLTYLKPHVRKHLCAFTRAFASHKIKMAPRRPGKPPKLVSNVGVSRGLDKRECRHCPASLLKTESCFPGFSDGMSDLLGEDHHFIHLETRHDSAATGEGEFQGSVYTRGHPHKAPVQILYSTRSFASGGRYCCELHQSPTSKHV